MREAATRAVSVLVVAAINDNARVMVAATSSKMDFLPLVRF